MEFWSRPHIAEGVQSLYKAKNRSPQKACIILVADPGQIPNLSDDDLEDYLKLNHERPTTIILPVNDNHLPAAPRQNGKLAFRLFTDESWQKLIGRVGPLLAPSANPEGLPPAENIEQAKHYFEDSVDVYVDGGQATSQKPSRIVEFNDGKLRIIRS